MDQKVAQESHRVGRYLAIRVVSRGGDILIFGFLLWLWGMEQFVPAFIVSALFNYITDFFGQKMWTFQSLDSRPKEVAKEFGFYILIRGGNIACAGGLWYLLYEIWGMHWLKATIIVICIFWTIVFCFYRYLFIGSFLDLVEMIRKTFRARSS